MTITTPERRTARTGSTTGTYVVGFDGSDPARAALRAAMERAGPDDRISVIHAYARVSDWIGDPFSGQALQQAQEDARRVLELASAEAAGAQAEVTLEMHEGAPAEVLTRIAALRGADEIIVGSRGFGRLRAALGSVSHELVHTADRPVLVVPAKVLEGA